MTRRPAIIPFVQQELRLLWTSRLARVGIVAVVLIPLLYGGTYLWAFWNPTGHLERIPAAIVNEDVPATVAGTTITVGEDLTATLTDTRAFAWSVTSRDEANAGVADGTYYFALVIPSDFSAGIASAADPATARQAQFSLLVDDANSYIGTTVASMAVAEVRTKLAAEVGSRDVQALLVGLGDVRSGISTAADGASRLSGGLATLQSGAASLTDGARTVASGAASVSNGSSRAAAGASELSAGLARLKDGTTTLRAATARLTTGATALEGGASTAAAGAAALARGTAEVAAVAKRMASGAGTLSSSTSELASGSRSVADGASTVADGTERLARTLAALGADPNLDPATAATLSAVAKEASALAAGADRVAGGASAVDAGASKLDSGAASLAAGAADLAGGASSAAAGAARLAGGSASVAGGAARLATGARALNEGAGNLASGATDALAGARLLASGTDDLAAGAARLADGARGLASGAGIVASGITDARAGATTLASRLADGTTAIPSLSGSQATSAAQAIAAPVTVDTVHRTPATTYGVGLAPYFVGLALWVGAVFVFGLIRPVARRRDESGVEAVGRVLAGFLQAAVLTAAQALVLLAVLVGVLGLAPAFQLELAAFLVLTAIAFTAIVQALNAVLGGVGRVVAIAFLIVQLAASGGTYPIETAPDFFRTINPYLPMTYVVNAVRRLISGGGLEPVAPAVIVLLAVTAASLAISWAIARAGREKEGMIDFGPTTERPAAIAAA